MVWTWSVTKTFTLNILTALRCTCWTPLLTRHPPFYQTDEWRLSEVNKDFSVCPSYPPLVAVPKDVDDDTLRKAATFRHSGRFPVLSYYHKKNGMVSTSEKEFIRFCFCCKIFLWDLNCVMADCLSGWFSFMECLFLSLPLFRWWCEPGSLWPAPTGDGVRKTRSWSTPPCGRANVATSLTHAPSMLPSRPKLEVEDLSLRLTTPSGGGSTRQSKGEWSLWASAAPWMNNSSLYRVLQGTVFSHVLEWLKSTFNIFEVFRLFF